MNNNVLWLFAFFFVIIIVGVGIYLYYKNKNATPTTIYSNGFPHGFAMGNRKIVMWDPNAVPPNHTTSNKATSYFSEQH